MGEFLTGKASRNSKRHTREQLKSLASGENEGARAWGDGSEGGKRRGEQRHLPPPESVCRNLPVKPFFTAEAMTDSRGRGITLHAIHDERNPAEREAQHDKDNENDQARLIQTGKHDFPLRHDDNSFDVLLEWSQGLRR
jgi:hypothetical protein